ncbi:F-box only protein 7 [Triticum urartu]|uniref:F-box only protein 7 n=2 Tax=Triticum urartu TaxID=4572 RepID=M7ZVS0_TRIUA|nr:F-box only protein 7-like [Triticum urartu]XP_048548273.1 F-box only protein 7-like [Triticum urartu]EMS67273.1 F-box only protein 7 [Triticum urartu]
MESCSVARIMSLRKLAIHRTYLCTLIFRNLPKLLGFTPRLLKKFCKAEHVELQLTKKTTLGTLPELPPDILMGIFATLEIPDLVRAGSVCSSWRSTYTSLRSLGQYKLQQTPCLLYTSESAGESVACLYSLAEKRSYKLTLPEPPIRTRCLIGSSHGWLVTVDDRSEMHLVNPITCEQIALPSVITIEQVSPIVDEYGALHKYEFSRHTGTRGAYRSPSIFALDKLRHELHYKAFVFPDTSTGSYIVVLIHNPVRQLSFARVGDDKWTWLPPHEDYSDCTYKDGLLYAVTGTGELHAFDFSGPVITMEMIISMREMHHCGYMYIAQAPLGDLLLVWRIFQDYDLEPEPGSSVFWNSTEYKIYEFDPLGSKLKEINRLSDHVLFLGHNQSLCLSAEEYPSLSANHAYFTDDNYLWTLGFKNNHRDMGILNLDDNSREDLESPQLWSNFPAPMWITPDLRKMNLASGWIEEN